MGSDIKRCSLAEQHKPHDWVEPENLPYVTKEQNHFCDGIGRRNLRPRIMTRSELSQPNHAAAIRVLENSKRLMAVGLVDLDQQIANLRQDLNRAEVKRLDIKRDIGNLDLTIEALRRQLPDTKEAPDA